MDKLLAAKKQFAELQELARKAANDPQARAALEARLAGRPAPAPPPPPPEPRKKKGPDFRERASRPTTQSHQGATTEAQDQANGQQVIGSFLGLDAERFRQAFIIKEILSPPPSLRDDF